MKAFPINQHTTYGEWVLLVAIIIAIALTTGGILGATGCSPAAVEQEQIAIDSTVYGRALFACNAQIVAHDQVSFEAARACRAGVTAKYYAEQRLDGGIQ